MDTDGLFENRRLSIAANLQFAIFNSQLSICNLLFPVWYNQMWPVTGPIFMEEVSDA